MAIEFKDSDRYKGVRVIIPIISPHLRASRLRLDEIGQEVWAIAKFRSRKSFVFMVAVADVFDKVL
jgi:hypothetical protein